MLTVNEVRLIGRVGNDVELRYTQNGTAVTNVRVATNEGYKNADGESVELTAWHNVVCWGTVAETAARMLYKGAAVEIAGTLNYRDWADKDGVKHTSADIKAFRVNALSPARSGSNGNGTSEAPAPAMAGAEDELPEDDLPF